MAIELPARRGENAERHRQAMVAVREDAPLERTAEPRISMPSGNLLGVGTDRARLSTTAVMRSLSLTRSSPAP
jgi:hypothetical protein